MKAITIIILGIFLSSTAYGSEARFMKNAFPGCATKEIYSSTLNLMTQNNWNAVALVIMSGKCINLEAGSTVFIEDATITGLVRVRLRGETSKWWTGIEQVSK